MTAEASMGRVEQGRPEQGRGEQSRERVPTPKPYPTLHPDPDFHQEAGIHITTARSPNVIVHVILHGHVPACDIPYLAYTHRLSKPRVQNRWGASCRLSCRDGGSVGWEYRVRRLHRRCGAQGWRG